MARTSRDPKVGSDEQNESDYSTHESTKHKREVWRKGEKPVLVLGVNTGFGFSAAWAANTLRATCAFASRPPKAITEVTISNAYF